MQPQKANDAGASRVVQGDRAARGRAQPPDTLPEDVAAGNALPQLLCERVDWLTIAWSLDLSGEAVRALRAAGAKADEHGSAPVVFGAFAAEVKRSNKPDRFTFRNGDFVGVVDLSKRHQLEITASGAYCAQVPSVPAILAQMQKIVDALGAADAHGKTLVHEVRVRRFDICADFVSFPVDLVSRHALLFPRGTKDKGVLGTYDPGWRDVDGDERARGFIPADEQHDDRPDTREYANSKGAKTGHTICAGSVVMGRVYNKSIELRLGHEDKQRVEETRWTAHGWRAGAGDVTRVEFQLRGEALDEAELRDPAKLHDALDSVWAYLTRKWVRLIVEDTATRRHRCETDPRWRVVQDAPRFVRAGAEPIVRRRRRAGASSAQALGAMLSSLASAGRLLRIHEPAAAAKVNEVDARAFLRALVTDVALTFATLACEDMLRGKLPSDVAEHVTTKISAAWARSYSTIAINDVAPKTWHVQNTTETSIIAYEAEGVERCWPPPLAEAAE